MSDESVLRQLNAEYIAAYLAADVRWYDKHLSQDFTYRKSDGSLLDRATFLRQTAEGPDVTEYRLEDVRVRVNGDLAEVEGTGSYTLPGGAQGTSRYIDRYRRIVGEWRVVSALVTRVLNAPTVGS